MSNFLAVAAVTASLSHLLQSAVGADVPGATVTTVRPDGAAAATHPPVVNLYLFQVLANAALRNSDVPTRRSDGRLVQKPVAALDLHYLLTFYGDEAQLQPQRLLGSAVRTLHARPVLTRDTIQAAISDPTFVGSVGRSDLGQQIEKVKVAPLDLSLEELSKLWSVFFQTPHALSAAYQATVVLIESEDRPTPPNLPVRQPSVFVLPFRQPVIDRITAATGPEQPIVVGSTLLISGQRLRGEATQVRLGTLVLTPATADISDAQISLPVPAGLRAGVQGAQVIQPIQMGSPPAPHRGFESNVAAFVLRPTITVSVANVTGSGNQPRSGDVTVGLQPAVGQNQRVVLLLSQLRPPAGQTPGAFTFVAPPRDAPTDPLEAASITVPVSGLPAGTYLVRVQVDGAESLPSVSADGRYDGPGITL
jgi:hypothetical protein